MNLRIKHLWTSALRSGDYPQGTLSLQRTNHFCVLGVLCEVAVSEGVATRYITADQEVYYDNQTCVLPLSVVKWAALPSTNPTVMRRLLSTDQQLNYIGNDRVLRRISLLTLNDSGMSFTELADLIDHVKTF